MSFIQIVKDGFQSKNFARFFFMTIWSLFTMTYIMYWSINAPAETQKTFVHSVFTFLSTSLIMGAWGYWYGTTQGSQEKDTMLANSTPTPKGATTSAVTVTETSTKPEEKPLV